MISNFIGVGTQMGKSGSTGDSRGQKKRVHTKEEAKQSVLNENENINKILRQSRKFDELKANIRSKTITEASFASTATAVAAAAARHQQNTTNVIVEESKETTMINTRQMAQSKCESEQYNSVKRTIGQL
mmetsp:Transcript_27782/g.37108  ORF Transcript_27782/g.37108 Transcript_27782/m.37108 type:complete len:130 (-) Transcript_27782:98-487(-)